MLGEEPKHPCRGCAFEKRSKIKDPCASCPLPGQYDDALRAVLFPTMAFMRDSSQFGKEKKGMEDKKELYFKTCVNCGDEKHADTFFNRSGKSKDGYEQTCIRCKLDKKKEEKNEQEKAPGIQYKTCVQCGDEKELNEKNFGHHAKTKDGWAKTCLQCKSETMQESNKRRFFNARRKKFQAKDEGPVIELDFTKRPEIYNKICKIAEEHLREPENQVMWWIMNADFDKLQKGLAGE